MKHLIFIFLFGVSAFAAEPTPAPKPEYMTPEEIKKKLNKFQFSLPTLEQRQEKPLPRLEEVIPKSKMEEIDLRRRKQESRFLDYFMPSSHAMGCSRDSGDTYHRGVDYFPPKKRVGPTTIVLEESLPVDVDFRFRDNPIRNQFNGTCTAFGLVGAMENLLAKKSPVKLSERHLWSFYEQYSAYAALAAASRNRITEEKNWPIHSHFPLTAKYKQLAKAQLVEFSELNDDIAGAVKALASGNPVYFAFSVPVDLQRCHPVVRNTRMSRGGHAVAIVGYHKDPDIEGGGYFIIRNSWGENCGDHGYQYLPMGYCNHPNMYCLFWDIKKVKN